MIRYLIIMLCCLLPLMGHAQDSLDFLRSTGKIYAVVLTVVVLFLGIVWYLWRLDRRVSKMEKDNYSK